MYVQMGIDLGGTNIRAGLVDGQGRLCDVIKERTRRDGGPQALVGQIIDIGNRLLKGRTVQAVGICAPGVFMPDGTLRHATNLAQGVEKLRLVESLKAAWGLPVFAENDANAAALGEYVYGSGKGSESMYYVTVSTGIGGGFVWKGNIIQGFNGFAGEVGSVWVMEKKESFRTLAPGAVEGISAGDAVLERARESIDPGIADAGQVLAMAAAGNKDARRLVDEMVKGLARMFADISCVVNPEVFVLGGGCMKSAEFFLEDVIRMYRELVPESVRGTRFVRAGLEEPGILGCAVIAGRGV